ncbi:MAG: DUF3025 domain-containing protein [Pseudomonadota bacterium]
MLPEIDWSRPWYDSVRPAFQRLHVEGGDFLDAFNAGAGELELRNAAGQPLRFVAQDELPEGRAYEEFIGATGCVPTRDNLHDFFNGLVWLTFPLIKRQLNALQAAQIAQAGVGKSRGPARDGATIFDENSALLVVRESTDGRALVEALREHRWHDALCEQREAFGRDAEVWLFGHALMEKLVAPRKAITAHTWVVWAGDDFFALPADAQRGWIDARVAAGLAADQMNTARFTPLQVLGVPGWCDGQDAEFYADTSVFRPRRA